MTIIFGLVGGLGLFIYGFFITSKSFQYSSTFNFQKLTTHLTGNVLKTTFLGFLITILIQSSSATTVLLVTFTNAGLITLKNSIGVILGSNIGTTMTTQIIAFNLDNYILPAIGVAVYLKIFAKNQKIKTIGSILLGFSILFLGLSIMKDAVTPLKDYEGFKSFLLTLSQGKKGMILALLVSIVFTAIIQASGAIIGILIAFASVGLLSDISLIIPIILGSKIGTCVTAFIASIKASREAKRVALAHFIFNVLGAILTLIFINPFLDFIKFLSTDTSRQIANAHTFISIFTAIFFMPFGKYFVKLLRFLIPVRENEGENINLFDPKLLETPALAIGSVRKILIKMGELSIRMFELSSSLKFSKRNIDEAYSIYNIEKDVDRMQKSLSLFIMRISKLELSTSQNCTLNSYREISNDLERISDHSENITDNKIYMKREFSDYSNKIFESSTSIITNFFKNTFFALVENDEVLAKGLLENTKTDKEIFKNYIKEVHSKILDNSIDSEEGMLLIDMIYNIQGINFHLRRILYSVIRTAKN